MKSHAFGTAAAILLVSLPAPASGQSISGGIRADVSAASFRNADYDTERRMGIRAGLFADLPLSGLFGVRGEAVYAMKGVKIADSSSNVAVELDYIEVPVMVKITPGNGSGFFLVTGPSVGFKISSELTSDEGSEDYGDLVKGTDFGWVAGLGFDAALGGTGITLDVRYSAGLTSVFDFGDPDDTDSDDKNQVISAGIGVRIF